MKTIKSKAIVKFRLGIILMMLFLGKNDSYAQEYDMGRIVNKSSPESSSAGNYTSVDKFRGVLNYSIPISNYRGKEFDLPITLNYTSTGIKVDQIASSVGLGWNLDFGRVTRIINSTADDRHATNTDPCQDPPPVTTLIKDFYKISAMGYEDYFQFGNVPSQIWSLTKPIGRIYTPPSESNSGKTAGPSGWSVTSGNGTKYFFGEGNINEVTTSNYSGNGCQNVNETSTTAWLLTKIISKNNLDTYLFEYETFYMSSVIPNNGEGKYRNGIFLPTNSSYVLKQQMIKRIFHNGKQIIEFNYSNRDDLSFTGGFGNALSSIDFLNFNGSTLYKKIGFTHTYFGTANPNPDNEHPYLNKRLKLDKLTFYGFEGGTAVEGDNYQFEYIHPELLPSIGSFARDYLGLYNGKDSNINLAQNIHGYLANNVYNCNPPDSNRSFNIDYSLYGTLNKVKLPTGGYTEFEYGQNALNGGHGNVYSAATSTGNSLTDRSLILINAEMCESIPSHYKGVHPLMQTVNFQSNNYPLFYNTNPQPDYHAVSAKTSYIQFGTATDCYIRTKGTGVYLIQKYDQSPSLGLPETYPYCEYVVVGNNQYLMNPISKFQPGLADSNTIYYINNTNNSGNFFTGGVTTNMNTVDGYSLSNMTFPPGFYQVTLWRFEEDGTDYPEISIYEMGNSATASSVVNLNQTQGGYIDGFRIESITSRDNSGNFVSRTKYSYSDGIQVDEVQNYYEEHFEGGFNSFHTSKGYSNTPEIVHYTSVYEINQDENGADNGYVRYTFGMENPHEIRPFPQDISPTSNGVIHYNPIKNDFVTEKVVFNKYDNVVFSEKYQYNREMETAGDEETAREITYYNPIKIETTNHIGANSKIVKTQDFGYSYNVLNYKTTNTETESYVYEGDGVDIDVDALLGGIHSDTKGEKVFIRADSNHPYLITEIKASKPNELLETQLIYTYHNDGNLKETINTTANGTPLNYESYIYGYNDHFVVAKLTGVPYSDISPLTARLANIKQLSNNPVSEANEIALINELNLLRIDFPNAPITTYTYNPVYGVTSVTDPKGYTVFSEYDAFGRVKLTKEKNKSGNGYNIISENQYHTISNP